MKLKITLGFVLLLFAFSCKKDGNGGPIVGKWRSTEILFAPYAAYTDLAQSGAGGAGYIQFNWPNSVQSTFFSNCTSYSTKGNRLTLNFSDSPSATYTYTIVQDTLKLYPSDTQGCTGCNLPFVKE